MKRFWDSLVLPILLKLKPRTIIEIGSHQGKNTEKLLKYCWDHKATLHAIDPLPQFDVEAWMATYQPYFVFHYAKSLGILPIIGPADIVLIDGDHNWYTVYHELTQLAQVCQTHQVQFPVVLFHDIGWPYGRRDLYYNPDDVPAGYQQPYEISGILPGQSALSPHGINDHYANADHEGGPRNGVLTAVEDFMSESAEPLTLILIDGFHGFGILYPDSLAERVTILGDHFSELEVAVEALGSHTRALEDWRVANQVRAHRRRQREARERIAEARTP